MKKLLKWCLSIFQLVIGSMILALFILRNKSGKTLVVFDIDNTLSDTWPNHHKRLESGYFLSLPKLEGMVNLAQEHKLSKELLFLSNRPLLAYSQTVNWLKSIDIYDPLHLILTLQVRHKTFILRHLSKRFDILYYDDLSYNHENGKIKFYEREIGIIKKLDLKYFDYQYICKVNGNEVAD